MNNPSDTDDDWAELARELARDKPSAATTPAEAAHAADPDEAGFADDAGETDTDAAGEFEDAGDGGDAPAGESEPGDGQPGTGRKRRRRRRRRRKGGQPADATAEAGAPDEGEAGEAAEDDAAEGEYEDAAEQPAYRDESDEEDEPAADDDAEADEDAGGELLRELIASWDVPSWDDVVGGLYRPEANPSEVVSALPHPGDVPTTRTTNQNRGTPMADAVIDVVGVDDLPLIVEMYNQIFRPAKTVEAFRRRYLGRYNVLQMVARVKDKPAGFFLGFELKPDTFFGWFYGVVPEFRRMGIGSQLMEAAQGWAAQHEYETFRVECHNNHRPMMHLAIELGYDVVGMRWDADRGDNLVLFEKSLTAGR